MNRRMRGGEGRGGEGGREGGRDGREEGGTLFSLADFLRGVALSVVGRSGIVRKGRHHLEEEGELRG